MEMPEVVVLDSPVIPEAAKPRNRSRKPVGDSAGGPTAAHSLLPQEDGPGAPESDDEGSRKVLVQTPERKTKNVGEAKTVPPDAKEWQDVIGRIAVKGLANLYISWMLGDVEDELTDREKASIMLTDEDIDEISAPLAGFASKNPFLKKHGRSIVSFANSWEALVALVIWGRRVRKVARRHQLSRIPEPPQTVNPPVVTLNGESPNGHVGSNDGPWIPPYPPDGVTVFNPGAG